MKDGIWVWVDGPVSVTTGTMGTVYLVQYTVYCTSSMFVPNQSTTVFVGEANNPFVHSFAIRW